MLMPLAAAFTADFFAALMALPAMLPDFDADADFLSFAAAAMLDAIFSIFFFSPLPRFLRVACLCHSATAPLIQAASAVTLPPPFRQRLAVTLF